MNTVEKRDYIHNHLYQIDDKHLDEMFKKIKSIVEENLELTSAQEEELEYRVKRHKNGESKSYSWEDVKNMAKSQK